MNWRPDFELIHSTFRVVGGSHYWLLPLLPLLWLLFQGVIKFLGDGQQFSEADAQGVLVGVPLTVLAVFFGIGVIAGEVDDRSLEIAYTVPGGCERVWRAKLMCAFALLIVAEGFLALATYLFFTSFPPIALYGALQAATFYLVLATALAALFRSESAGAISTATVLAINGVLTGFGDNQIRISPFWNPTAIADADPTEIFAWTLQNRLGFILAMIAILALGFMRANRRERMLAGG
jgi:ABC-type transport system involved in multi-copper enzyme maturation permease subunit